MTVLAVAMTKFKVGDLAGLEAFYAQALSGDEQLTAADAKAVLGPTFEALGKGPVLFAKLQPAREHAAGALEVLP